MTTYGSDPLGTTHTDPLGTTDAPPLGATSTGSTTDKAKDAASAAADQSKHVAGTAKDEAANVAATATEQARNVIGDAKQQVTSQMRDQATTGRDKLSETLRTLGDDLQQMAQGQGPAQGMATNLAQEVSDRVRALGSHLENREPSQLLDDARDFARRRPGTFLLGALATGVVAGRLFRATADGAAAASLADTGSTATGTTGVEATGGYSTSGYDTPAPAGYDTPATTAPAFATPSSLDPTTPEVPGQRYQDLP
ncbi:hypothetical protein [Nocardioides sp.]|uniref:hypothetical protein n=1 Tax=Nocardioides sp. TaxID=35761 RepID=UPI002634A96B|nr:hypothetical protein [Nocardioides sp.]MCW2736670.1 hypothetical protein [Nocardioides sp.]